MLKKISLLFFLSFVIVGCIFADNRAFRTFTESALYDTTEGKKEQLITIARGDTVFATEETMSFLQENDGRSFDYIPVAYKDVKGYIPFNAAYPIKLTEQDEISFIQHKTPDHRVVQERMLVSEMEWAMNHTPSPSYWFYVIIWALVCGIVAYIVSVYKPLYYIALILLGICLSVVSFAEIMYLLAFHNYVLWFIKPSIVGGWGKTILNFIILGTVIGTQFGLYYMLWRQSFESEFDFEDKKKNDDEDDDDEVTTSNLNWIRKLAFLPPILGIVFMIVIWADYFSDGSYTAMPFIVLLATLPLAGLIGLVYQFSQKRFLQGIIFPVLYVSAGFGLVFSVMILNMLIVLVLVAAVIGGSAVMLGVAAIAGVFATFAGAGKRVTGYTSDGRKVSGTQDAFGNIKGDDGNTYTTK